MVCARSLLRRYICSAEPAVVPPQGYFCPTASTGYVSNVCSAGSFCPAGTWSGTQFLCPAGTISTVTGAQSIANCSNVRCPVGQYCPAGTAAAGTPCPIGRYNPATGGVDLEACRLCDAGTTCNVTGLSAPNAPCAVGSYCPEGQWNATAFPCPAGTYYDLTNATKEYDCLTCPAGFACPQGTGGPANAIRACAAGYYCPAGTKLTTEVRAFCHGRRATPRTVTPPPRRRFAERVPRRHLHDIDVADTVGGVYTVPRWELLRRWPESGGIGQ